MAQATWWRAMLAAGMTIALVACAGSAPSPAVAPTSQGTVVVAPTPTPVGTPAPSAAGSPSSSASLIRPSGRIAVVAGAPGATQVLVVDSADPTADRVLGPGDSPAWSPDGRQVAFACRYDRNQLPGLCMVEAGDPEAQPDLVLPDVISVTWAPTGDWLMLGRSAVDMGNTVRVRPDGGGLLELSVPGAETRADRWSPDGTRVAGLASPGGASMPVVAVCTVSAAGCAGFGRGAAEAWSPQGDRIAYLGAPGAPGDAFALDPASAEIGPLLDLDAAITGLDWSSDGRLAVVTEAGELVVLDAAGATPRRIAADMAAVGRPSWSPDGAWVAVRATSGERTGLVAIPLDGGAPVAVAEGLDVQGFAWAPAG